MNDKKHDSINLITIKLNISQHDKGIETQTHLIQCIHRLHGIINNNIYENKEFMSEREGVRGPLYAETKIRISCIILL